MLHLGKACQNVSKMFVFQNNIIQKAHRVKTCQKSYQNVSKTYQKRVNACQNVSKSIRNTLKTKRQVQFRVSDLSERVRNLIRVRNS